jgi:hypothetical protein
MATFSFGDFPKYGLPEGGDSTCWVIYTPPGVYDELNAMEGEWQEVNHKQKKLERQKERQRQKEIERIRLQTLRVPEDDFSFDEPTVVVKTQKEKQRPNDNPFTVFEERQRRSEQKKPVATEVGKKKKKKKKAATPSPNVRSLVRSLASSHQSHRH